MNTDKITKRQKKEMREIFRRAQELITINDGCCDAIEIAQRGNSYFFSDAHLYFKFFFHPKKIKRLYWMALDGELYNSEAAFIRRLMALQLCELSLS